MRLSCLSLAAVVSAFAIIVIVGCGSSSTTASSTSAVAAQSGSSSPSENTTEASTQSNCQPHYIEGKTGDEVAESVTSLYDCIVSRKLAGNRSVLEDYARYILGEEEFAVNGLAHSSTIPILSEALSGLYKQNPGATVHMATKCQDIGATEDFQQIVLGETQTNEGFNDEAVNVPATDYTRYIILPTTPKVAGFPGGGNEKIWVIEEEAALGEEGDTYPNAGSCQQPLDWQGAVKPTYADNSLPSL